MHISLGRAHMSKNGKIEEYSVPDDSKSLLAKA
jgi:hypothetical protein